MSKKRIVILVSGRGSNMEAILKAIDQGEINGQVVGVVSSNPVAPAIQKGQARQIPVTVVDRRESSTKVQFEQELLKVCAAYAPDLLVLAGFMHILSPDFIRQFPRQIINIHPSLLPSFPGLSAHKQALEHGVKLSGCTVHFVDEGTDTGPIILQAAVPVYPDDDEESLAQRILVEEHRIYPLAVSLFCADRLKVQGRKVVVE